MFQILTNRDVPCKTTVITLMLKLHFLKRTLISFEFWICLVTSKAHEVPGKCSENDIHGAHLRAFRAGFGTALALKNSSPPPVPEKCHAVGQTPVVPMGRVLG